jgi:hypothetical protein
MSIFVSSAPSLVVLPSTDCFQLRNIVKAMMLPIS